MTRPRTLRRRVVVAMVGFTASVCLIFSALSFLFAYVIEDEFLNALLENEATHIAKGRVKPRLPFVTLYRAWAEVPEEVRNGGGPSSREIPGRNGRHYHLRRVPLAGGDAWLVAEVSSLLVVRPMRAELLTILVPTTLIVLLVGSLIAVLVARRSVRQLSSLVDAVQRNEVSSASITDEEVRVVAEALEGALARVHALLEREKAFVGDVSHELRTPLAVIRGATELLERREMGQPASAQVRRIRDAMRSSEEIVEMLLALAREETAREERASIPLLALTERLVLRHRGLLPSAEGEVEIDIAPQTRIVAAPTAAEIVISNLISNAMRHGAPAIAIKGDETSISVSDRGHGLDPSAPNRGIGLKLVRRLCDLCGFELVIESSPLGTAARVSFAPGRRVESL
jgi:signal transduction histidine kinase